MKQKLLLIIGAGASIEFGMPTVTDIDKLMNSWSREIAPIPSMDIGLYGYIKEKFEQYAKQNNNNRLGVILNFESILYTIQQLAGLYSDLERSSFHNRLNPFIQLSTLPDIQHWDKICSASGEDLGKLQADLVDKLLSYFRATCKDLSTQKQDLLQQQKQFLDALNEQYQLGIINLNYDNVIDLSRPDLVTGFRNSDGSFDRSLLYAPHWNFIYHMHGSVHFDMKGGNGTEMHKIFWNWDLNSTFSGNSRGRNLFFTGEGDEFLTSAIIAGLGKSNQLLREPFGSYFSQLDRLIYEADKILFIGYGFNDMHVNNSFPFIRYDGHKFRKVMVIDHTADATDGLSFRHDEWSFGLGRTIPFNGHEMGHREIEEPHHAGYYRKRKTFERSINPNLPLSVWYNGYGEAMKNTDKILNELA
jgi:hypothetical protein